MGFFISQYIYSYMKIVITESQYLFLQWWESNKDFLGEILELILDEPRNWFKEINFGSKEDFMDSVIDMVWEKYAYKKNIFYDGGEFKKILKEMYFDDLSNYYDKF